MFAYDLPGVSRHDTDPWGNPFMWMLAAGLIAAIIQIIFDIMDELPPPPPPAAPAVVNLPVYAG